MNGLSPALSQVPPHDLVAERAVLAASLLDAAARVEIVEILRRSDFYHHGHQAIFGAISELHGTGSPVDVILVRDWLEGRDQLEAAGGADAIHNLADACPTTANSGYHAEIVRDKALRRRAILLGARMDAATRNGRPFLSSAQRAARGYGALAERARVSIAPFRTAADILPGKVSGFLPPGLSTGLSDLDRKLLGGFRPRDMVQVQGESGIGKSLFLNQIAHTMVEQGARALVFPFEDAPERLIAYMVARLSFVNSARIARGTYAGEGERGIVEKAHEYLRLGEYGQGGPLSRLYFAEADSFENFLEKTRSFASKFKLDRKLVAVDPLHALAMEGDNEADRIGRVLPALRQLVADHNLILAYTVHMNREGRARGHHGLEHVPSIILHLEPDEGSRDTFLADLAPLVKLQIRKAKNAETGPVGLRFDKRIATFQSLAREPDDGR